MRHSNRIRIALQKSGRLNEDSLNLLRHCGIKVNNRKDQLFCHSENFPLDLLRVRDDDIPSLVINGICDYGIVGTNVLQENALQQNHQGDYSHAEIVRNLDFGVCRLAIAVPEAFTYENLQSLNGKRIATSYPYLLGDFFKQHGINAEITVLTGSVEIAPRLGIAHAICDLVSTGATLEANNLREVDTIFKSRAVLIKNVATVTAEKQHLCETFENRIEGVLQASGSKYIMLHAPKAMLQQVVALLPGVENPTVMNLQGDDERIAIHALCRESVFWETMEELKAAGASSILVLPVEKMMA
ncbi:ATP phosphoribosyltransferase [soil metagenome]